jgi:hypothetical protein
LKRYTRRIRFNCQIAPPKPAETISDTGGAIVSMKKRFPFRRFAIQNVGQDEIAAQNRAGKRQLPVLIASNRFVSDTACFRHQAVLSEKSGKD